MGAGTGFNQSSGGGGGGGTITGSGTANYISKFISATAIGNSLLSEDASNVYISPGKYLASASAFARFIQDDAGSALLFNDGAGTTAFITYNASGLNTYWTDSSTVAGTTISSTLMTVAHSTALKFDAPIYNFNQLTASTVPYLDASGNLVSSSRTPTQLSYLDATSSIQTQLNSKGSGTVTSVSGTANQVASTGGVTPVLSLVSSAILPGSPTIVSPGNSTQNIITTDATQTLSNKTFVAPALGTPASGVATNLTGTAASLTAGLATALATARTIGGVSFNGTANITVSTATAGFTVTGGDLSITGNLAITGQAYSAFVTLTDAANISTNCNNGMNFKVTLGGNRVLDNPTNLQDGATYTWKIKQDGTGTRTLTYGSKFDWGAFGAPVLTTTINKWDYITGIYDSTEDKISVSFTGGF